MDNSTKNKYFIIFGGGGIRGLCYCGAYKALLEKNIDITGYAGSSIGAVFASLAALGYNFHETYEILSSAGFEMFIDINVDFKKELAISKGKIFLDWMRDKIERKFYKENYKKDSMPPVKFSDIDKNLIIYSVDLTNLKFHEFSRQKTPDFEIAEAIRASVSMPGLFTPLELNDTLIVDGDLLKSSPLWRMSQAIKNNGDRILEFRLEDNETPKKISNSIEYLNRVYNALSGFATDYVIDLYKDKDKFDYIKINTPDVSVVDFLIPQEKRKELFEIGYKTTTDYFENFLPNKRKALLKKYKTLLELLLNFQKELKKKNSKNLYIALCEIFVFLCEENKYLDFTIHDKITDFKNLFKEKYKTTEFLGIKKENIENKEELTSALLDIIKIVTLKTLELKD